MYIPITTFKLGDLVYAPNFAGFSLCKVVNVLSPNYGSLPAYELELVSTNEIISINPEVISRIDVSVPLMFYATEKNRQALNTLYHCQFEKNKGHFHAHVRSSLVTEGFQICKVHLKVEGVAGMFVKITGYSEDKNGDIVYLSDENPNIKFYKSDLILCNSDLKEVNAPYAIGGNKDE